MNQLVKNFNANEYCSWIISKASPHNIVIAAEISGNINLDKLEKSMVSVSSFESNLSYTILPETCGFIQCNKKIVIKHSHYDCLKKAIEKELETPFVSGDLLIRAAFFYTRQTKYFIICAHHAICDGVSLINFILNSIKNYNGESFHFFNRGC